MKKFIALAKADIQEQFNIKDELLDVRIDPVFENGMEFSGEILIAGKVYDEGADEDVLGAILQDYLREYVEFARVRNVEFRTETKFVSNSYRRAG